MNSYQFVKNQPVAKFYYKGDHTHPVRRTILIIEQNDQLITGYELREGSTVRTFNKAPIKSYRKDRIAKVNQIDSRRKMRKTADDLRLQRSTMVRSALSEFIKTGA